ncbi:hypothetical protein [Conexibacter arvalis]|uniref:Uncharacterized protein n=1 Tax=Conexibacter arvalis TaxID=912552 RepID=A0A840I879_9ACTN|nr:hypothetical protein [Conexibacter arvalis]MBB4660481.1 hypothetical protein [Conexibacter arvalis]
MNRKSFLALLGFLFVAAWIALSFGDAILCLLGAALFYAIGAVIEGEIDLGEMQSRMRSQQRG